jgi:DMSO/TMAO reductase YedYZ molybdopterin-dependent catalytic subunit
MPGASATTTMHLRAIAVLSLAALLTAAVAACAATAPTVLAPRPPAAPPATSLGTIEIRDFEGKRLDAVAAEPENSIEGTQHVDVANYRLTVSGMVRTPQSLTYAQVLAMPAYRKVTTLHCIDGWSVTYLWQGVLLEDLLASAGYDPAATVVIFRCADGYEESLPVSYVIERHIMLAYGMNGTVMPPERGFPFQVVAEDKLGYKWAKWVTAIELSDNESFRGYWEVRGADNTATVPAGGK